MTTSFLKRTVSLLVAISIFVSIPLTAFAGFYRNSELGWKILVPRGWSAEPEVFNSMVTFNHPGNANGKSTSFAVFAEPKDGRSFEEFLTEYRGRKQNGTGYTVTVHQDKPVVFNKKSAHQFDVILRFLGTKTDTRAKSHEIIIEDDSSFNIFICGSYVKDWGKTKNTCDAFIKSFKKLVK
ncbi:MAG: hypothetical protein WAV09_02535 [Minisyncoccia bacterium]